MGGCQTQYWYNMFIVLVMSVCCITLLCDVHCMENESDRYIFKWHPVVRIAWFSLQVNLGCGTYL